MNCLVITAGGKSSRMGKDKVFLKAGDATFLEHLAAEGQKIFGRVIVAGGSAEHAALIKEALVGAGYSCRDNFGGNPEKPNGAMISEKPDGAMISEKPDGAETRESPADILVLKDDYEAIGPMGALLTVFESGGVSGFVTIPVDVPFASMEALRAMLDLSVKKENTKPVLMLTDTNGKVETLAAAYTAKAYDLMKSEAELGHYSLVKTFLPDNAKLVTPDELKAAYPALAEVNFPLAFRNINTPDEYEKACGPDAR